MLRKLPILSLIVLLAAVKAFACYAPPAHLMIHHSQLIKRTSRIALAKLVSAEEQPDHIAARGARFPELRYRFKTLEVLKGDINATFAMDFWYEKRALELPVPETDFDGHRDRLFWDKMVTRQENGPDCRMHPRFSVGVVYLIFMDETYHWRSFERIIGEDDRWLSAVRNSIRTGNAGLSQTLDEYLSEQYTIDLVEVVKCPDWNEAEPTLPYLKVVEHIHGERQDTDRFYPDFRPELFRCTEGLRFLLLHNKGEDSKRYIYPSAAWVIDGVVDFSRLRTEIEIKGPLRIPYDRLKAIFE